eukprot:95466-Hanusia_phi.AAC.8
MLLLRNEDLGLSKKGKQQCLKLRDEIEKLKRFSLRNTFFEEFVEMSKKALFATSPLLRARETLTAVFPESVGKEHIVQFLREFPGVWFTNEKDGDDRVFTSSEFQERRNKVEASGVARNEKHVRVALLQLAYLSEIFEGMPIICVTHSVFIKALAKYWQVQNYSKRLVKNCSVLRVEFPGDGALGSMQELDFAKVMPEVSPIHLILLASIYSSHVLSVRY